MTTEQPLPAMTPQQARLLNAEGASAFTMYRELAAGNSSLGFFAYFEALTLAISNLPGLPGFALRALLYPSLFGRSGKRPAFGRGVVVRNPKQIYLGRKVAIDDYAVMTVRGASASLTLQDCVSIGRFTTLVSRESTITIGAGSNIGAYCRIATESKIEIGESVLIGAYSYVGPGNHKPGNADTPMISREMDIKGGVRIGSHAWLGTGVTVLDGVSIGERAVIGAHSLVLSDVPAGAIAVGSPAKVIRMADDH